MNKLKKIAGIIAGMTLVAGAALTLDVQIAPTASADTQYWAEVSCDAEGVCTVLRVIVADYQFIQSGAVGDPANWVETFPEGENRGIYASRGTVYDPIHEEFVRARPSGNFVYNPVTRDWDNVKKYVATTTGQ